MARTVLIVPCYNEASRLDADAFVAGLDRVPGLWFRFVDDGSTDGTLEVLEALRRRAPERIAVTRCAKNGGKSEAVRQGVLAALRDDPPDYVGYWDADLATPLVEVPRFVERFAEGPDVRVVLGSRVRLLGHHIKRKMSRHVFGRGFATVVSTMLSLHVYDTQCGAKLFKVDADLEDAFGEPFMSRWVFDVELLVRLMIRWEAQGIEASHVVVEQPLARWEDVAGSKVSFADGLKAIAEVGAIGNRYRRVLVPRRARIGWADP
ncbi:MAG: glycosyltransferase [Sandaracinaceae bacterium]|nr:glycosyltransferase [Sandaracinaceae bacterium]